MPNKKENSMNSLATQIDQTHVQPGTLAIFFLGQAGFVIKNPEGKIIYVDPYLSDACNRMFGFKRIFPAPLAAEEVHADLFVITHEHGDHYDTDALPVIAQRNPAALFAGPIECIKMFKDLKIPDRQLILLEPQKPVSPLPKVDLFPLPADHGDLSPDALGIILTAEGKKIYFPGDTAFRADIFKDAAKHQIDIAIPPINGKFGNLDSPQAAEAVKIIHPKLAIPCHFWLFIQHNGNPAEFLAACEKTCPAIPTHVMAVGEKITYPMP
jgi:L-ascorbate 6-phosphate lactonase